MQLFDTRFVNRHWRNNLILMLSNIILFVIGANFNFVDEVPILSSVFFTLLVLSSIFVIDYIPLVRRILMAIGFLVISFIWLDTLFPNRILQVLSFVFLFIFLFGITISLIVHVAASSNVNANIIFSAINGYLLIGILGGISLLTINVLSPITIISNVSENLFGDYMYFSFVTLTTLGYGDLLPVVSTSKVVAMLLSIVGQLYIAILIAMLVGKFLSSDKSE